MTDKKQKTNKGTYVKLSDADEKRLSAHEKAIADRLERDYPNMGITPPTRKLVLETLIRAGLERSEAERGQ